MKNLILYFIVFLIPFISKSEEKYTVCWNYLSYFHTQYQYNIKPDLGFQLGWMFDLNENIIFIQYCKINGFDVEGITIGKEYLDITFKDTNIKKYINKIVFYGGSGFFNTSHANKVFPENIYSDVVLGIFIHKSQFTIGLSYSYFCGFMLNIGINN